MELHIIYTETAVFLSKKAYSTWQEVQRDFSAYKASLGPWLAFQVVEYLDDEHPALQPGASQQVAQFLAGSSLVVELSFAAGLMQPAGTGL